MSHVMLHLKTLTNRGFLLELSFILDSCFVSNIRARLCTHLIMSRKLCCTELQNATLFS